MRSRGLACLLAVLAPLPAAAQAPGDSVAHFLEAATAAAGRYADRAVAVREGFRRVGPDFPGMGEHWVQPGRLVSARFLPDAPPILTYITIDGRPVLAGVAYALPLSPGETPPRFPQAGTWHDHSASVDEESLLIAPLSHAHAHAGSAASRADAPRLAMLHAWLWSANPDGVFAQDNWALPYIRLGVEPPVSVDPAAARALSLLSGGDGYYHALFRAAADLDARESAALADVLGDFRAALAAWHAAQPAGWSRTHAATLSLQRQWVDFWSEVRAAVRPETWQRLSSFAPDGAPHR